MDSCLDLDILEELVDIMGDDMEMLLDSYFTDSTSKLEKFATMNCETDQEAIFRLAHSLKGSSRNVGVVLFADFCENIEHLAKERKLKSEDLDIEKLNELFNRACEELKQRFL